MWQTPAGRIFCALLAAGAASLVLSAALSQDLALAFGGTIWRRLGAITQIVILFLAFAAAARASLNGSFARRLLIAVELAGAVAASYGILQYFGWDPLLPAQMYTVRFTADVVRPPATLRHAIYFANFLVPVVLIAASEALHAGLIGRCFHAAVSIIAAAALLLTGTRSAVLGLALGAVLLAIIEARRIGTRKMLTHAAASALAGLVLVCLLAVSPAGQSFRTRLEQWIQDAKGGARLMVWRDSWLLVRDHAFLGIGPETFAGEFRRVQSLQLSQAYPDYYHEDPHNLLIGAAVSQGFAGLTLLAGFIALGLVCSWRAVRNGKAEGAVLAAVLAALTLSEQFAPLTITNCLYFYLMIALAVALVSPSSNRSRVTLSPPVVVRAAMALAAVALLTAVGVYLLPDFFLATAGRRLVHLDLSGARESYRRSVRFPFSTDNLWFSQQMAGAARSLPDPWRQEALVSAKEASFAAEQSGEQRFSALYQSAALAVITGDLRATETKLRVAIEAAPRWYRAHEMLAQVLWLTGRGRAAEHEAALALECAGRREPEVKATLEKARVAAAENPR